MTRSVLALLLGLVLWVLVASAVSPVLRVAFEGYRVAERRMTFTPGMMIARLAFGALASVIAGAVTKAVAPSSASVSWLLGAILLVMFIPLHAQLWAKFPAWYHLVFLGSLVPLVVLGAALARSRSRIEPNEQTRSS